MSGDQNTNPRVIPVRGTHYQMGFQHGQQVSILLPQIETAMDTRFAQVADENPDEDFERLIEDTIRILEKEGPAILDFMRGQADGLRVNYERLQRYNLVTYLSDVLRLRNCREAHSGQSDEGCSTWAASNAATFDGQPILVKTRDTNMFHLPLQTVVRAEPEQGHRYTYITSAGSPGVYVAGFNEAGLALVDTHVPSTDIGPGLPTYALSMHVLENHETVASAIRYLKSVPRQGRNNLVLADATGDIAIFEIGYENFGVQRSEDGCLVNTNHFSCDEMRPCFVDTSPIPTGGDSFQRHDFLRRQLKQAYGQLDVSFAKEIMGSHADDLSSICRHPVAGDSSGTVSASIYLPAQKRMFFCHGFPCSQAYTEFGLV